ncbi:MAG: S1 RNA-binding domain-containing protein, partial [Deltaproteobacteria bacterium]|nr:S1 RNA-binding domain-containing protein [Deltaproteobacteria bacterium]
MALHAHEDFKSLFEEKYKNLAVKEGAVLKGKVVMVHRDTVAVDVGFKSEGLIPLEEFRNFDGQISVSPGEEVDVVVEQLEDKNGNVILSKERADAVHSWDRVESVFKKDEVIEGLIVNKIKGG